jgi:hypothetical protein
MTVNERLTLTPPIYDTQSDLQILQKIPRREKGWPIETTVYAKSFLVVLNKT